MQFWFMQRTLPNGSCMLHVKWLQALKDVLSGANVSALVVMHEAGANWSGHLASALAHVKRAPLRHIHNSGLYVFVEPSERFGVQVAALGDNVVCQGLMVAIAPLVRVPQRIEKALQVVDLASFVGCICSRRNHPADVASSSPACERAALVNRQLSRRPPQRSVHERSTEKTP